MMKKENLNVNKRQWDHIRQQIYATFFLRNFSQKNLFQQIFSIIYTSIILLISCIGVVPLVFSFTNAKFNDHIFFIVAFSLCFIYLFDLVIRFLVLPNFYGVTRWSIAIRKQLLSFYSYIEILTVIATIVLLSTYGEFVHDGIKMSGTRSGAIAITIISFLFLLNILNCLVRLMVFSHNTNEIKLFRHVIKSKLKIWLIFTITIIIIIFAFSFFIYASDRAEEGVNSDFNNMWDAIYFAIVTVTTVGYGDIVAKSSVSRTYVIILMIIGIFLYSFFSSQIISVFSEYFAGKKLISEEVAKAKKHEDDINTIIERIDEQLINTLFAAGLIKKAKYDNLKKSLNKNIAIKSNKYDEKLFCYDPEEKIIYYRNKPLGNIIEDKQLKSNAEQYIWAVNKQALKNKKITAINVLYHLPMKLANNLTETTKKTPVIFTSKEISSTIKKLIIYQKKPYISTICEANVVATLKLDKEIIWKRFGVYTNLSKKKYMNIFKEEEQVTAILINDIIVYENPKCIQEYGINDPSLLKGGITPLH